MPPTYNDLPGALEAGVWGAFEAEFTDSMERWRENVDMLLVFASSFFVCLSIFVSRSLIQDAPLTLLYNDNPLQFILHYPHPPFCLHRSWFTRLSVVCNFATLLVALVARHQMNLTRPALSTESLRNRCVLDFFGLLAVSVTCFFVGLLARISYGFAFAVVFGASALSVSISLSILPILRPDCAYKMPLTHHCFAILNTPGAQQFVHVFGPRAYVPFQFDSLRHVEVEMVTSLSDALDVSVLVWLFNEWKVEWDGQGYHVAGSEQSTTGKHPSCPVNDKGSLVDACVGSRRALFYQVFSNDQQDVVE
ncbi:hypothetical protein BDZ89DRAFT_1146389 [Hymenopellis radicata]|nr:hypothetical protein BDZ89DRAFT_1146389 [Hymenopellis radicata]